jgi:FkbM family methyltransferase
MKTIQTVGRRLADRFGRDSLIVRGLRPAYEAMLNVVSLGRGVPYVVNGTTYRIDARHRRHCGDGVYDPIVADYLRARIRPGQVCFNIGANVGVYALQLATWSGPDGKVIAFEPNPAARAVLERHLRYNGIAHRVRVEPYAVGAAAGSVPFFGYSVEGVSRVGRPNELLAGHAVESVVTMTTLDEYCERTGVVPDWIVIDIEGFEFAALAGGRRLLTRHPRIGIVMEVHASLWPSADTTPDNVKRLVAELGRRIVPFECDADPFTDHCDVALEPL